ncbi:MAG: hypothetical protein AAGF31_06805 [Planctomycetota bacterium]
MGIITQRVELAREGNLPELVCRMPSGWAVMGDVQVVPGYCLLLPDPVVTTLNDLAFTERACYLNDMATLGDAVLKVTGAVRINYAMLGNLEPELHAHVFPRYADEPAELRTKPVWLYNWDHAQRFHPDKHGDLQSRIREELSAGADPV